MVTKKDLKDFILDNVPEPRPFLYCGVCGSRFSANKGDWWMTSDDYVFMCCGEPMILAKECCTIQERR